MKGEAVNLLTEVFPDRGHTYKMGKVLRKGLGKQ